MTTLTLPGRAANGAVPVHHTQAELAAVLRLLDRLGADTVVLGSARDSASLATRAAVAAALAERGRQVLAVVDWPEAAASWARQARLLVAPRPDAWVVCARAEGWGGMVRRLARLDPWSPGRTLVTASLSGSDALSVGDPTAFAGLRGVTRAGRTWQIAPAGGRQESAQPSRFE